MPKAKTLAKWGAIGTGGLVLAAGAALALGFTWLSSEGGRTWLAREIENAVSTPGEVELSIGRLEGDLPGNLIARDIVLRDSQGAWLTVEELTLDWQPWALLERTLQVDSLALTGTNLARLPVTAPAPEAAPEDTAGGGLPSLPVKLRLNRLVADEIALGAPVLGQAASFSLAGQAASRDDGGLSAGLDLLRLDGVETSLRAKLDYTPAEDYLIAEVNAVEAPGGLVAALLDVPDLPRTELHLSGSGPLGAWDGDFRLSLGEVAQADAAISLRRGDGEDLGFSLRGQTTIEPPSDSDLWALAAGRTDISLDGAWQAARRLHLDSFTADKENLRLAVKGDLEPEGGTVDMTLTAETDDAAALARLLDLDRLGSLSADVALTGTLNEPQAAITLRGADIATPDFTAAALSAQGRATARGDLLGPSPQLELDLNGRVDEPRLPGQAEVNQVIGAVLPFALQGSLALDDNRLDIDAFEASLDKATLSAKGPFNLGDGSAALEATLTVGDLAALQPLTDITLGGAARLAGPVKLTNYGSAIEADLAGRWDNPASDIGLITAAAGKGLDVATRLTIAGGEVRLEQVTAQSPTTDLEASLVLAGGELRDGRYRLKLADAAVLADELGADFAGSAEAEGSLAGPFDALQLNGSVKATGLTLAEQKLKDMSGSYDLRLAGADIDGPVSLSLASPFGRAEARAELKLRSEAVTLSALQARLPQSTVTGEVVVPLDGGDPRADLTGDIADLGPWLAFAGLDGGGKGKVTVKWNQPGAAAPLLATADLSGLSLRPAPDGEPLRAAKLTARLSARDPALEQPAHFSLDGESLQWQRLELSRLGLTGDGTLADLDLTLAAKGKWIEPLELRAAGRVARQGETLSVALREAEGQAFGQPLALQETARLTLAPNETRLEGLDLASGETRLTADARLDGEQIAATANLQALPMATVEGFWANGLAGTVSARLDLQGPLSDPRGTARLTAKGLRPRDVKDLPELDLTSSADWRDGRVKLEGQLGGAEVTTASFAAEAPLRLGADGASLEVPEDGALSGKLDWSGGIDTVLLFVPLPQHRLTGQAEVALTLGGTVAAPKVEGDLSIQNGRYENLETGTLLRDLSLTAQVADGRAKLARLTANDGAGGRVSGDGELMIDPAENYPFDAKILIDKFHALRRDDVTAVASGDIRLEGDTTAPKIIGRFTTETVEVSLLTSLPPNVVKLDVIEVKDGVVQEETEEKAKAKAPPPVDAQLDIVVDMPKRVFVRGRGLDSEWAGRISVQGSTASPRISGELNVVRGEMSVVGKAFKLDEGKVTLPEGSDTEPRLDVTAQHEGETLDVTARLSGPVSKPELELTSVPEVPRDEIISRVLFNKPASELSAAEAAQLALAVRELAGGGGGADILGFARRTLGVDVLRVDTTAEGKAAVEAGKYLTDDVYVGVKQGATSQSTGAEVEVELTPNVTIESEVTGSGANKSGVRFKLDY